MSGAWRERRRLSRALAGTPSDALSLAQLEQTVTANLSSLPALAPLTAHISQWRAEASSWEWFRAADGNIALTAEIDSPEVEFRLAVGFGRTAPEAALIVRM